MSDNPKSIIGVGTSDKHVRTGAAKGARARKVIGLGAHLGESLDRDVVPAVAGGGLRSMVQAQRGDQGPAHIPGEAGEGRVRACVGAGDGAGRDEKICARASPVFFFAETVSDLAPGTGRPGGFGASDGGFGDVDGS